MEREERGRAEVERDRLASELAKERVRTGELEDALRAARADLGEAQALATEQAFRAAELPFHQRAAEAAKVKAEGLAEKLAAAEAKAAEALEGAAEIEAELSARDVTIAEQAVEIESARVLVEALHGVGSAVDVIAAELRRVRG